eukprot:TRINITY_DN4740_c0_g2_i12.p1 TRINITY_DN4740_c0_g2~~TRINITY_DN4740_c0_g2_i12.p1  ORF type:complete len:158 (+),score=12.59 TRINITY_DN4740_c0_g2_i12:84-557(+)
MPERTLFHSKQWYQRRVLFFFFFFFLRVNIINTKRTAHANIIYRAGGVTCFIDGALCTFQPTILVKNLSPITNLLHIVIGEVSFSTIRKYSIPPFVYFLKYFNNIAFLIRDKHLGFQERWKEMLTFNSNSRSFSGGKSNIALAKRCGSGSGDLICCV